MHFFQTYVRVLKQLGAERRLAGVLVAANLALAIAQFAEPVLFGRIVDVLSNAQAGATTLHWTDLTGLLGAWVGFGLFTILAAVLVALHADRLAQRRRLSLMAEYFEHVLHLPLGFHVSVHSGRLSQDHARRGGQYGERLAFILSARTAPRSSPSSSCCQRPCSSTGG